MNDMTVNAATTAADGAEALVIDTTTRDFGRDVIEESRRRPVLVDFWAPWCGPCRTLSPIIEKAVKAANGAVRLVKMNIDDHPSIAGQMGIQSIPAVIAFVEGRPVDGFLGAIPEGKVKEFIDKVSKNAKEPVDIEAVLVEAEALLESGDANRAGELFAGARDAVPDDPRALGGLIRAAVKIGDFDAARQFLAMTPPAKVNDPAIAKARAAISLAEQAAKLGDPRKLAARIAADPSDHAARFDLALVENALGNRHGAIDQLIEIMKRERGWNDEQARKQLVQFFEAWGPKDDATIAGRRRLSSLLFS
jgi:putative thioredoxin